MVEIDTGVNVAGHGGRFRVASSYPTNLSPCHSLVDRVKLDKKKVMVVVHTNDSGETSITEKEVGKDAC